MKQLNYVSLAITKGKYKMENIGVRNPKVVSFHFRIITALSFSLSHHQFRIGIYLEKIYVIDSLK